MNKVLVHCWEIGILTPSSDQSEKVFITYPEDNSGHTLVTCLSCGAVYAVTVAKEVYVGPPLAEKLSQISCSQCARTLGGNWAYYPETHLVDGKVRSYKRPTRIPPDEESIVREFYGVYE